MHLAVGLAMLWQSPIPDRKKKRNFLWLHHLHAVSVQKTMSIKFELKENFFWWFHAVSMQKMMSIKFKLKITFFDDFMLYPCRKQCPLILWFQAVSVQKIMSIKFWLKDNFVYDFMMCPCRKRCPLNLKLTITFFMISNFHAVSVCTGNASQTASWGSGTEAESQWRSRSERPGGIKTQTAKERGDGKKSRNAATWRQWSRTESKHLSTKNSNNKNRIYACTHIHQTKYIASWSANKMTCGTKKFLMTKISVTILFVSVLIWL